MKKLAIIAAAFVATSAAMAGTAHIAGTLHNFKNADWNDTGSICQPCHTPHAATAGYPRLWSRADNTATYEVYDNATVTQITKMCLSCHDGATALGAFAGNASANASATLTGANVTLANSNLGTSLKDDHPVGFVYQNGKYTTDYVENGTRTKVNNKLPLKQATAAVLATQADVDAGLAAAVGDVLTAATYTMECTTCHNPHGDGPSDNVNYKSLLRLDTTQSADPLCSQCHTK